MSDLRLRERARCAEDPEDLQGLHAAQARVGEHYPLAVADRPPWLILFHFLLSAEPFELDAIRLLMDTMDIVRSRFEQAYDEMFISTATTPQAIQRLARLVGAPE